MSNEPELMTDGELDALLAHASKPPLPLGAKSRLLARLAKEDAAGKIVPVRQSEASGSRLGWLAGLPLAASLALGIYLGAGGGAESYLPSVAYDLLAGSTGSEPLTGIDEVESINEDDLT